MTTVTCMVAASLKQFSKQRYKLVNNCLQPFHIITSRASAQRRWLQTLQTRNMTENELNVQHDREKCEFFIQIKKDETAEHGISHAKALLEYSWVDKKVIDMYHTLVPPEFRGKGVAKLLAKEALEFAVSEDLKYYLSCSYLQKYVNDNPLPKYKEHLMPSNS